MLTIQIKMLVIDKKIHHQLNQPTLRFYFLGTAPTRRLLKCSLRKILDQMVVVVQFIVLSQNVQSPGFDTSTSKSICYFLQYLVNQHCCCVWSCGILMINSKSIYIFSYYLQKKHFYTILKMKCFSVFKSLSFKMCFILT